MMPYMITPGAGIYKKKMSCELWVAGYELKKQNHTNRQAFSPAFSGDSRHVINCRQQRGVDDTGLDSSFEPKGQ